MTATLRFDVVSNGAGARRDMSSTRREVEKFGSSADRVARQSETSRSRIGRFGASIASAAKTFGPLAVAAAGAAVVKFGVDAVKAASETQQSFGAVDAVFGKNAATVKKWANSAATDLGLARGEYAQLSATLGAALRNAGVENFTQKTRGLITTAADLAAQFGGSTSEAVEALGSLMRGEADPIERYGISIKQSDVNARLAALGQAKLTGTARKQAEMTARLTLVTQQSKTAHGAFRRESNTLAGQQQRLSAQFTNVKDKLGGLLIPALTRGLTAVNGLFSGGGRLTGIFNKIGAVARSYLTPIINAVRGAVSNARESFASTGAKGDGLKTTLRALGAAARFLAPLIGQTLGLAIRTTASFIGGAIGVFDRLASAIASVVNWVDSALGKLGALADKAGSLGSLGGLLRVHPSEAGLARAAGSVGGFGGVFAAPSVSLTSSPHVSIEVDSPAMARLFRVIVRDELRSLGADGGKVA